MRERVRNLILVMMPAILMAIWVASLFWQVAAGVPVKIKIRGYDPLDLLAGRYINYTLDWDATDCSQFVNGVCPKGEFDHYGMTVGRFYVAEYQAETLEKVIRNGDNDVEMVFSYRSGRKPYVLNLLVNGVSWGGKEHPF